MSELSCDTLFIGRNETHDLSRYQRRTFGIFGKFYELDFAFPLLGPQPRIRVHSTLDLVLYLINNKLS